MVQTFFCIVDTGSCLNQSFSQNLSMPPCLLNLKCCYPKTLSCCTLSGDVDVIGDVYVIGEVEVIAIGDVTFIGDVKSLVITSL